MTIRKIDLMHREFGFSPGNKCKTCSNLVSHFYDKRYYKCSVYGESASEATDWALRWDACGLYNKDPEGKGGIVRLVRGTQKTKQQEPIDGQKSLFEEGHQ